MRRSLNFCLRASLCVALTIATSTSFAAVIFSDDFSVPGALVGSTPDISTGNWGQTGASVVNPITVAGGSVALLPTGQDAYAAFSSGSGNAAGNVLHTSFDINLSAAGTGDYFTHLSDPVATTSFFFQRIGAVATSGGYFLTLAATAGGGATTATGTTVLSVNTPYRIDANWTFVNGALNDTFDVSVNGSPYVSKTWDSSNAEPLTVTAANFRQGTAGQGPTLTVDNLNVELVVPEPGTLLLAGVAAFVGFAFRRGR